MGTTFQLGGQGYHIAKRSIGFGTEAASDGAVDSEKSLQVGWLIGIDFLLAQTSIIERATGKVAYSGDQPEEGEDVEGDEDTIEAELTLSERRA